MSKFARVCLVIAFVTLVVAVMEPRLYNEILNTLSDILNQLRK